MPFGCFAKKRFALTTDITHIWTLQGWIDRAVVIDLYSRRVVGWHMDRRMETGLVSRVRIARPRGITRRLGAASAASNANG